MVAAGGTSLLAEHAGHLAILAAWVAIFGAVAARQKLRRLGVRSQRLRRSRAGLATAAALAAAAAADWQLTVPHAPRGPAHAALIGLTGLHLAIALVVLLRPSEQLLRAVAGAAVAVALGWVVQRGLAGPGAVLSVAGVAGFAAQLACAGLATVTRSGPRLAAVASN